MLEVALEGEPGEGRRVHARLEDLDPILAVAHANTRAVLVLQDFAGVPLLCDLAAMRGAAQRLGANPKIIEPLVPVDLVVDHSVQVDHYQVANALDLNMRLEFKRNAERFPDDFMFQLTREELTNLKSQIVTSSWGGARRARRGRRGARGLRIAEESHRRVVDLRLLQQHEVRGVGERDERVGGCHARERLAAQNGRVRDARGDRLRHVAGAPALVDHQDRAGLLGMSPDGELGEGGSMISSRN